jgi:uncharacterized membrane protein
VPARPLVPSAVSRRSADGSRRSGPDPGSRPPAAGPGHGSGVAADPLMRVLGWASLGLGVPQAAAPGWLGRFLGVGDAPRHQVTTSLVGARELAAAAGLLWLRRPAWLWGRVGGDVMDLARLGRALKNHDGRGRRRTVLATAAVIGITAVDVYGAVTRSGRKAETILTATTTVARPPEHVFDLWWRLETLPSFMAHLDEVRRTGEKTSHWRASAPFGKTVEWDAEIIDVAPPARIAWQSIEGSEVDNAGEVRFTPAPGNRGTEVHVTMRYSLPAGKLGAAVARYFGEDPHQQLDDDLRRFKQVAETGEVLRSDGAPGGKRARREFPQHPARPLALKELEEVR